MLNEEKVNDIFSAFVRGGQGEQEIKQIYEALPYLSHDQQRVLTLYNTLAKKYNSEVIRELSNSITTFASTNRHLGFTFKRMVEAISLYKHFKGFKASASMGEQKE